MRLIPVTLLISIGRGRAGKPAY